MPARVTASQEPDRRLRRILMGSAIGIAIAVSIWTLSGRGASSEPHYQGRPLSYWLAVLGDDRKPDGGEAPRAIRTIGTNGIPWLLRELQAEDPPWKQSIHDWIDELSGGRIRLRSASHRRECGVAAFRQLRAIGTPAIPNLVRLFARQPVAFNAAEAAAGIGPAAIPGLARALHDPNPDIRATTVRTLGWLGRETPHAFEPLATALKDRQAEVRYYAVEGFGHLKDPASASLLRERFTDEARIVRVAATNVWALLQNQNGRRLEKRPSEGSRSFVFEPAPGQGRSPTPRE